MITKCDLASVYEQMLIFVKLQSSCAGFNNHSCTHTHTHTLSRWSTTPSIQEEEAKLPRRWHGNGSLEKMASAPPQLSSSHPARDDGSERINEYDKRARE